MDRSPDAMVCEEPVAILSLPVAFGPEAEARLTFPVGPEDPPDARAKLPPEAP